MVATSQPSFVALIRKKEEIEVFSVAKDLQSHIFKQKTKETKAPSLKGLPSQTNLEISLTHCSKRLDGTMIRVPCRAIHSIHPSMFKSRKIFRGKRRPDYLSKKKKLFLRVETRSKLLPFSYFESLTLNFSKTKDSVLRPSPAGSIHALPGRRILSFAQLCVSPASGISGRGSLSWWSIRAIVVAWTPKPHPKRKSETKEFTY